MQRASPPAPLFNPDGTTSHSTKASKNDAQVAGYLPLAGEEANEKGNYKSLTADSPCIGHCTTVLGDDVCRSCLRTFDEITRWVAMDEDEQCAVNRRIALLVTKQQHQ